MLHLEKVNGNNVWDILKLTVSESQKTSLPPMRSASLKRILQLRETVMHSRLVYMMRISL